MTQLWIERFGGNVSEQEFELASKAAGVSYAAGNLFSTRVRTSANDAYAKRSTPQSETDILMCFRAPYLLEESHRACGQHRGEWER